MGLLQDLTKLNQEMAYCENRLEQIRAKELQGIELTEKEISDRIKCKDNLKKFNDEWERLIG